MKYFNYIILLLVILASGVGYIYRSDISTRLNRELEEHGFIVEDIELYGRKHTSLASVHEVLDIGGGEGILSVDIDALRERLNALPWVKSAMVHRQVPNRISIKLMEHEPAVIWQTKGRHYLVSTEGEIIDAPVSGFSHLPIAIGDNAFQTAPSFVKQLSSAAPEVFARLKAVVREGNRRWTLMLDDLDAGIEVKLPEGDVSAALDRLLQLMLEEKILDKNLAVLDLRQPGKMVVRFHKVVARKQDS